MKRMRILPALFLLIPFTAVAGSSISAKASPEAGRLPAALIFAPGVISGPANDGTPTFSPDGKTLLFTRSASHWSVILESHWKDGQWAKPSIASVSGQWPDSSPAWSPDGTYVVFQSTRPKYPLTIAPKPGEKIPGIASNLWRVDRIADGWGKATRLPDTVNVTASIWKPSIARNGDIYFTVIGPGEAKSLYMAARTAGAYTTATQLPFSSGAKKDVDPEIAVDESFIIFSSAGRNEGDSHERLYLVRRDESGWGTPTLIRYQDDVTQYGASTDNEPKLGRDGKTLYFSSDRSIAPYFPRSPEQAQADLERLDLWDNSNANVWSISLEAFL